MSFSSYANFQAAVADQLARNDLTTQIVDFITLFEAYAARKLQVRQQETTTTLTTSGGSVALPSDYLAWRSVIWNGTIQNPLTYVHPSEFAMMYPSQPSGVPYIFTITGSTLKIMPVDDTGLKFDYYAKNTAISSTLNWLFNNYPDFYYSGTLFEAYSFIKDPDNAAFWKLRRDEQYDEIRLQNFRNAGGMRVQVEGITP